MLSRLLLKPSHIRYLTLVSSKLHSYPQPQFSSAPTGTNFTFPSRFFSSKRNEKGGGGGNNGEDQSDSGLWKLSEESDGKFDPLFGENFGESAETDSGEADSSMKLEGGDGGDGWETGSGEADSSMKLEGGDGGNNGEDQLDSGVWKLSEESDGKFDPLFGEISGESAETDSGEADSSMKLEGGDGGDGWETGSGEADSSMKLEGGNGGDGWETVEGHKAWSLAEEEKSDLFDIGEDFQGDVETEVESSSTDILESEKMEAKRLEKEEKELTAILKGPNRAFGDLIAASGITDEMLDSLIALKDLEGVEGLPPLSEIEDLRYEKSTRKSSRAEIERQKQEDYAKARVRQVDEKGRAYGTGRRKCSVARVWIEPGDGNFLVNDKQFDVYFPMLDHRAALLRPFSETKTLGRWDVKCTVQGGGVSGQVGAIRLGISRALQNWEPDLRPALKSVGFLTRDPRAVERKKPGKAKARKSFQWVKR